MEIKDFIKNVLVDIVKGVYMASEELEKYDVDINPTTNEKGMRGKANNVYKGIQNIDFDISVTLGETSSVANEVGASISAKIFVVSLFSFGSAVDAKAKDEIAYNTSLSHRIKFSVPISLPSNTDLESNRSKFKSNLLKLDQG